MTEYRPEVLSVYLKLMTKTGAAVGQDISISMPAEWGIKLLEVIWFQKKRK